MSDVNVTPAALVIIRADVTAHGKGESRYARYVRIAAVTHETRNDHVAAFRNEFKAQNPDATGDQVKAYATLVRNGLTRHLPAKPKTEVETDYLARLIKAAEAAQEHGITVEQIQAALGL